MPDVLNASLVPSAELRPEIKFQELESVTDDREGGLSGRCIVKKRLVSGAPPSHMASCLTVVQTAVRH